MIIQPIKTYETKGVRDHVRAQQIWIILTAYVSCCPREITDVDMGKILSVGNRASKGINVITYGDLAILMGYKNRQAGRTLANPLGLIGHYCKLNNLPPLNTIVVNSETRAPGCEVVVRDGRTYEQEQAEVMTTNWLKFRPPSTATFRKVAEYMRHL